MAVFDYDCAVIGGGPAGLVSALYLGRYRRPTIQFSFGRPRASWIPRTHNLLGYRGGISGQELLRRLTEQVSEVGVDRVAADARVHKISGGFRIDSELGAVTARKVILATGMEDVHPIINNLYRLRQQGLLRYCPICDAYEYKEQPLAVLAQDDHGLKTAMFLSRYGSRVDLVIAPEQKPSRRLLEQCLNEKIKVHRGTLHAIERRLGKKGVILRVDDKKIESRVCYVALGTVVNDVAWRHLRSLKRAEDGRLQVGVKQETPIAGLFAVGDCVEGLAQIAVAAGGAATAATAVHNQLRSE